MKKQIEITEKKTRTVDVEVPSFYNEYGVRVAVTDYAVIKVWPGASLISFVYSTDKARYSEAVDQLLQYRSATITEQEFDIAFNNAIKCLTEQYQLSKNMQDPNAQQPANQEATEQAQPANEQATESAAQDQAMGVDSEEGGTEG
jgi:hypothetical protein